MTFEITIKISKIDSGTEIVSPHFRQMSGIFVLVKLTGFLIEFIDLLGFHCEITNIFTDRRIADHRRQYC